MLYTVVEVPSPDPEARRKAIRAALEGMTPYPVDDLVFDWSGSGTHLKVAVVARETLEEAEAFARRFRFNPVSLVAQPDTGKFIGEPYFGPTECAATLIEKDAKIERDLIPIQVVGRAEKPASQARPIFGAKLPFGARSSGGAGAGGGPASDARQVTAFPPDSRETPVAAGPTPVPSDPGGNRDTARDAAADSPDSPAPPAEAPADDAPASPPGFSPRRSQATAPDSGTSRSDPKAHAKPPDSPDSDVPVTPEPATDRPPKGSEPAGAAQGKPATAAATESAEKALFTSRRKAGAEKPPTPVITPRLNGSNQPAGSATPATGVAAAPRVPSPKAAQQNAPAASGSGAAASVPLGLAAGLAGLAAKARAGLGGFAKSRPAKGDARGASNGTSATGTQSRTNGKGSTTGKDGAPATPNPPGAPKPPGPSHTAPQGKPAGIPTARPWPSGRHGADKPSDEPTTQPGQPKAAPAASSRRPPAGKGAVTEAEAMTIFGARRREQEGTRPLRTGLVLVGVLVLALVGAAIWAAYFLSTPETAPGSEAASGAIATGEGMAVTDGLSPLADAPADGGSPSTALPGAAPAPLTDGQAASPSPPLSDSGDPAPTQPSPSASDPVDLVPFNVDQAISEAMEGVAGTAEDGVPPGTTASTSDDDALDATPPQMAGMPETGLPATVPAEAPSGLSPAPLLTGERIAAVTPQLPDLAAPDAAPAQSAGTDAIEGVATDDGEVAQPTPATREELIAAYDETGIWPFAPDVAELPRPGALGDVRPPQADDAQVSTAPALPGSGEEAMQIDEAPAALPPPAPFASVTADLSTEDAAPADVGTSVEILPDVTVTEGTPDVQPPLRREVVPRLMLIQGAQPVPEGATPLARPAGLGVDATPPASDDQQGALQPALPSDSPEGTEADEETALASLAPVPAVEIAAGDEAAARPAFRPAGVAAQPDAPDPETEAQPPPDAARAGDDGIEVQVQQASLMATPLRPTPRPGDDPVAGESAIAIASGAEDPPPPADGADIPPGGLTLAALRPRTRPEALATEAGEQAELAAAASALAVPRSPLPGARPAGLAAAAARQTQEAAASQTQAAPAAAAPTQQQQPAPTQQVAASAATAATPNIPTRASVAQQATVGNAINLRRLNLIGVFGTPSDRRALVRLPNGQIASVRVGDRLDGGQVAAIGDAELRYVKNGRNNVLRVGES